MTKFIKVSDSMNHLIVIPYYNDEEVKRYERIVKYLLELNGPRRDMEFLLSSSSSIEPNARLASAFSQIAPVQSYACKNTAEGYPARPCTMFWEAMDFIRDHYDQDGGFVLWFESDMIPVKGKWVEKLEEEWISKPGVLLMGPFVKGFAYGRSSYCPPHINGGSCYAKNYADYVPLENRRPPFDINMFAAVGPAGRFKKTQQIAFSTLSLLKRHVYDRRKVLLHGFRQDKNKFLSRAMQYVFEFQRGDKMDLRGPAAFGNIFFRCCKRAVWSWQGFSRACPIHER